MVLGHVADLIGEQSSTVNKVPSSVNERPSSVIEGSSSSTRFVFDALKAPTLSDLTWKRSVHCNLPPKGKRIGPLVKDQVNQRAPVLHSEG